MAIENKFPGKDITLDDMKDKFPLCVKKNQNHYSLVVDRLHLDKLDEETLNRVNDSIEVAFFEGRGKLFLHWGNGQEDEFSNEFSLDGILFEEPSPAFFTFNTPQGACPDCEGFGSKIGIDKNLVEQNIILESLIAFKRAGANAIVSYYADRIDKIIR